MTEQLPRENFDDLLPDIPPVRSELAHKDSTLTAEAIGYTSLSRDFLSGESLEPLPSFKKAWSVIELGLTAPSYKTRQGFLNIAEERLDMLLEEPTTPDDLRMRTVMARTAIPSFRERAEQEPLTESLQFVTYHRQAQLLSKETNRELYQGKGVFSAKGVALGFLCENLAYAMLLKSWDPALFPFPAAPREDQGNTGDQNHDLYIPFKDTKIPIQVKRKHGAFRHDGIIGIHLLTHINQQLTLWSEQQGKQRNKRWTKELSMFEPDVLLARYLDPANPECIPENVAIATMVIDGLSMSIGKSVREQMATIIRSKGIGITDSDGLV